jgi:undecaprenyl-diphosphatase
MNASQAIILGLVQGLTEFLPISSSGHLVLAENILGLAETPLQFDVILHLGTLVAVLLYFRNQLLHLRRELAIKIIVATIPAIIIGLALELFADQYLKSPVIASIGLIITGLVVHSTKRPRTTTKAMTYRSALTIGIAQAIAIIPGISRSGSTISTALNLGISQQEAFRFSFLMSIPAILGASVLEFLKLDTSNQIFSLPHLLGAISACIVGLASLKMLRLLISSTRFYLFGYYSLMLGIVSLTLIHFR